MTISMTMCTQSCLLTSGVDDVGIIKQVMLLELCQDSINQLVNSL